MEKIIHLLIPRESNNHKAKLIHTSSIFAVTFLLIVFQLFISSLQRQNGAVLGFASNISPEEVVRLTNLKRSEFGLSPLSLNSLLSDAAHSKGLDMINKDYWAHTAPDGTEPWSFFNSYGYKYRYAGENLARDFSGSSSAVEAWMQSPSHRDNILNPKYKEIGIGVVEGDLAGSDTTIIVQFFGTKYSDSIRPTIADVSSTDIKANETNNNKVNDIKSVESNLKEINNQNISESNSVLSSTGNNLLVLPYVTTKNTSLIVVSVLLVVYFVDWFIVSKKRITRVSGKTFAHLAFLGMVFSVLLILKAGKII